MNDDLHPPASPDAAPILATLAAQIGFTPNVFAVLGQSPQALEAFASMNDLFAATSLTAIEREIVQTAASVKNECSYCVAGHTAFADMQGLDPNVIEAVRENREIENHRLEALRRFSLALIDTAGRDANAELAAFLKAGYRKDQVFDVILGISIKMFSNLASSITALPLDDAFAPFEWSPADRRRGAA
tara:strand:+ start:243 stop:806 length:564 start_codon:yes stop_codon:yes gene_type:complete